jgi:hypothetical protein
MRSEMPNRSLALHPRWLAKAVIGPSFHMAPAGVPAYAVGCGKAGLRQSSCASIESAARTASKFIPRRCKKRTPAPVPKRTKRQRGPSRSFPCSRRLGLHRRRRLKHHVGGPTAGVCMSAYDQTSLTQKERYPSDRSWTRYGGARLSIMLRPAIRRVEQWPQHADRPMRAASDPVPSPAPQPPSPALSPPASPPAPD